MHAAAVIGLASLTASCTQPVALPQSPGCLIHLYTGPNLQGAGIAVMRDTPEFALPWRDSFSWGRVIWGTWRLFASPDYKDFMGDYSSPYVVPIVNPTDGLKSIRCFSPEPAPAAPAQPGVYVAP